MCRAFGEAYGAFIVLRGEWVVIMLTLEYSSLSNDGV